MSNESILYVDWCHQDPSEYCKGSKICINIIDILDDLNCNIQDCSLLRKKIEKFPVWLTGTPTFYHVREESSEVYKGSDAINFLRDLLAKQRNNKSIQSRESKKEDFFENNGDGSSGEEEEEGLTESCEEEAKLLENQGKITRDDVETFLSRRNK